MRSADDWLGRLAKLKVDRASGDPAPHKPLLLLVVLELAEQGLLPAEELALTPELAFRFATYWSMVAARRRQRPDVRYPFYYLKSDGCWLPLDKDRQPAADLRAARFARLPAAFVAFAGDAVCREQARRLLIAKYFPVGERVGLSRLHARRGNSRTGCARMGRDHVAQRASSGYTNPHQHSGKRAKC
jgi:putative restriction endonuclease